jgi:hypothetical protein
MAAKRTRRSSVCCCLARTMPFGCAAAPRCLLHVLSGSLERVRRMVPAKPVTPNARRQVVAQSLGGCSTPSDPCRLWRTAAVWVLPGRSSALRVFCSKSFVYGVFLGRGGWLTALFGDFRPGQYPRLSGLSVVQVFRTEAT